MEQELLIKLKELKTLGAKAIKAELSSELLSPQELSFLKKLAGNAGLKLTLKVSGAEDEGGIIIAKELGADNVVVPLIESGYSLHKFLILAEKIGLKADIFANVETINGTKNIDEILSQQGFKGVVFGRSDMCGSLGLTCKDADSDRIFEYAKAISEKMKGRIFCIGGRVSESSMSFLRKIPYLSGFETRKIVFDAEALNSFGAIKKALEFELLWLETKQQNQFDLERIEIIKRRLN